MTLNQKHGKEEYQVEIHSNRILYTAKNAGKDLTITLPFEVITRKTSVYQRSNRFLHNGSVYFAILTVVWLIVALVSGLADRTLIYFALTSLALFAAHRITSVPYDILQLTDGRQIRLLKGRPNRVDYRSFMTELYGQRDAYLRDTYARIDPDRPHELERSRIDWLKSEGVLDEVAYASIIDALEDHRENP